jgi:hypothetical protein
MSAVSARLSLSLSLSPVITDVASRTSPLPLLLTSSMMTYRVLIHKEASLSAAMEYVRYIS